MFSLVEARQDISKAQRKLEATIKNHFKTTVTRNIGHPGGTIFNAKIFTDNKYWYRTADFDGEDIPNRRRLNWFGLFVGGISLDITVEVNTTYEERNDQVAGFFARDNLSGMTYLMHSGRVGGGTRGVGKTAFLTWSNQTPIEVIDSSGKIKEGLLVMPIEGSGAIRPALRYIDIISRFKKAVRSGVTNTRDFKRKKKAFEDFYAEARGRRRRKRTGEIDYLSMHGDIVDALHSWRASKALPKGGRLVKSILIDLGVEVKNELVEIFEVKTSATRSDVYIAIGQLIVHGVSEECRRFIVLPQNELTASDLKDALTRFNIELLEFKMTENATVII